MIRLLLSLLSLPLCASALWAQVTFDNKSASVANQTGGTTISTSYTMGGVSNGAIVVPIIFANSSVPAGLAVTYNSVALTAVTGTNTGANGGCSCAGILYAGLAPASGSHTLSISWTGTLEAHATIVSFAGVNQTSVATAFPNGTFTVNNTATASPLTKAVTSATGNMVVAAAGEQTSSWGTISGNLIAKDDTTGPQTTYASNYTAGAATVNPSFAFGTASVGIIIATDVLAASGGSSTPGLRTTMGVGK